MAGSRLGIVLTTFSTRDSFDFSDRLQWEVLSSFLMVVDQDPRDGRACPGSHGLWIIKTGPIRSKVRTNICTLLELVNLAKVPAWISGWWPKHTCVRVCEVNRREAGGSLWAAGYQNFISLALLLHEAASNKLVPLGTSDSGLHPASFITFLFPRLLLVFRLFQNLPLKVTSLIMRVQWYILHSEQVNDWGRNIWHQA